MEMNKETLDKMRQMHLYGMASAFKSSLDSYGSDNMTNDQFVAWLISNEWDDRCNKTIERLIKNASFRYNASIEEIDYTIERGLNRNMMNRLADMSFVKDGKNLFIPAAPVLAKAILLPHSVCVPVKKGCG